MDSPSDSGAAGPIGRKTLAVWSVGPQANGFGALDLGRDGDTLATDVIAAGLRVGSVDLAEWQGMISAGQRYTRSGGGPERGLRESLCRGWGV